MSETEQEIDLASLSDDELVKQMHDDLYDGLAEEIAEGTQILLDRGWPADHVLNDALVEGMRIVGIDFRDGILFVPEVLLAANAMKAGMVILRPLLAETGAARVGKVVIGTVKGDIHDIGKNLVAMMLEGAGFEVVDLGVNNPVEKLPGGARGAQARHPRDVRAADHDDAVHEGRDRRPGRRGHPRRLHRAGRRRAAERGVRQGRRRRRLLPRRRRRRRDRPGPGARATCRGRLLDDEVAFDAPADGRPAASWSSRAARSRARCWRSCAANGWNHVTLRCLPGEAPQHAAADRGARGREAPRGRSARALGPGVRRVRRLRDRRRARSRPGRAPGVGRLPGRPLLRLLRRRRRVAAMHEDEPRTFYLTDFLCRHFDRFVVQGLGLDAHPELRTHVFRELRSAGLPVADRRSRRWSERAARRPRTSGSGSNTCGSGTATWRPSLGAAAGGVG